MSIKQNYIYPVCPIVFSLKKLLKEGIHFDNKFDIFFVETNDTLAKQKDFSSINQENIFGLKKHNKQLMSYNLNRLIVEGLASKVNTLAALLKIEINNIYLTIKN